MEAMDRIHAIHAEANRLEEGALFAEKGHQRAGTMWSRVHYLLGIPATLGSLIAGLAAVQSEPWVSSAVFGVAGITALMTFLVPASRAQPHWLAMNQFNALRAQIRQFRDLDVYDGVNVETLRESVALLAGEKRVIQEQAPPVPYLAYRSARRAIEKGESEYEEDRSG